MKIFSKLDGPLTREQAVNCAILNLLATPGLGSWLAGRKTAGAAQLLLASAGFCLMVAWFVSLLVNSYRQLNELAPNPGKGWLGLAGIGLFGAAWCLSLITSLSVLRAAPKS